MFGIACWTFSSSRNILYSVFNTHTYSSEFWSINLLENLGTRLLSKRILAFSKSAAAAATASAAATGGASAASAASAAATGGAAA